MISKGLWAVIATWTAVLLLVELGEAQPTSPRIWNILNRRQGGDAEAEHLYRGEVGRGPTDVEKDGGFMSRGIQKQRAGIQLSPTQLQEGSSLFHHAAGETAEFTRYVSTSTDPGVALTFAVDDEKPKAKGYIFKIHTDKRMIDINKSLGKYSPYPAQMEQAAIGFIPYEQIEGWHEVTYEKDFSDKNIGKATQEKLRSGKFKGFTKNPKFDKSYLKQKGTGEVRKLAGFPRLHPAWQDDMWKDFKTQAVEKNLDDMITLVCAAKGKSKRDANCLAKLGHSGSIAHSKSPSKKPPTPAKPGPSNKGQPKKPGSLNKSASAAWDRLKASRARAFRVTGGRAGRIAAFTVLAPFAHDVLDAVKSWDNPIGVLVTWFDDAMGSIQEAIGGPPARTIHGNQLKLRFICWLRGEQNFKNDVDRECDELRAQGKEEEELERQQEMIDNLNKVVSFCQSIVDNPPNDEKLLAETVERCDTLISRVAVEEGISLEPEKPKDKSPPPKPKDWDPPPYWYCLAVQASPASCGYKPKLPKQQPNKPTKPRPTPKPNRNGKVPCAVCILSSVPLSKCDCPQFTRKAKKTGNPKEKPKESKRAREVERDWTALLVQRTFRRLDELW